MTFEEMCKNVKYHVDYETPSDYSGAYDIRWWGAGLSELLINDKTMLEKAEKMLELAGNIPAMQSKIDTLTSKVEKMKMISPDDYVECENCGVLVNKNKAQVFSSVEDVRDLVYYMKFYSSEDRVTQKEAVLHYLCPHCDMKKFKKEKKY